MIKWVWIAVIFAGLELTHAAPVTTWVTNTYVTDSDGSTFVFNTNSATATAATAAAYPAVPITTATTVAAVSTVSGSGLVKLISLVVSLFSMLLGTEEVSLLSGSSSSVDSESPSSTKIVSSATPTTSTANALLQLLAAAKDTSATQTASGTESGNTDASSGIYAEIHDSGDGIDVDFAKAILDSHNSYRALHRAPALSWSQDAYDYAQNNAENYDCSGVLTHTHGKYGENLAAGYSGGPASVKAWYDEGETYDYSSANTYNHFTQVVWKSSTQLGCAYKDCRSNGWGLYVICEYDPPGNVIGEETENVLP